MNTKITDYAKSLSRISRERRRDFHRYAETAWLEMRTSAVINQVLTELGYEVVTGKALCLEEARIGVPSPEELKAHAELALSQGAPQEYLTEDMKEGFTGAMGILRCGPGPVVALRFDIDALGLIEEEKESHRPFREGFSSVNKGKMHACGHDGHGAIGLGVAEVLMKLREELKGTVKLIFQPGEEGAKGARAIVAHGHLDDVDYFVGTHIAPAGEPDDGDVTPGTWGSLATSKYDAHFYGQAAHAGGFPEKGRSAIVAAANAVLNLTALPRHSGGISRVNVGRIEGGTGRNVVPDHAMIQFEVRGGDDGDQPVPGPGGSENLRGGCKDERMCLQNGAPGGRRVPAQRLRLPGTDRRDCGEGTSPSPGQQLPECQKLGQRGHFPDDEPGAGARGQGRLYALHDIHGLSPAYHSL